MVNKEQEEMEVRNVIKTWRMLPKNECRLALRGLLDSLVPLFQV